MKKQIKAQSAAPFKGQIGGSSMGAVSASATKHEIDKIQQIFYSLVVLLCIKLAVTYSFHQIRLFFTCCPVHLPRAAAQDSCCLQHVSSKV